MRCNARSRLPVVPKSARVASMAAMDAAGICSDAEIWTKPEGVIQHRPERAAHFDGGYAQYLETLAAIRPLWHSLNRPP